MDHAKKIAFYVQEKSWLAYLAALVLKGEKVAIVVGQTIYLHGAKEEELLTSTSWLRHELKHVEQYQRERVLFFLVKYSWENLRNGYTRNRYEVEAREAERIIDYEKKFKVVSRRRSPRLTTNH